MRKLIITLAAGLIAVTAQADAPSAFNSTELRTWAAQDAEHCWNAYDLQPGKDHQFNWFQIGMKEAEGYEICESRRGINHNTAAGKMYEETFHTTFSSFAKRIEAEYQP